MLYNTFFVLFSSKMHRFLILNRLIARFSLTIKATQRYRVAIKNRI